MNRSTIIEYFKNPFLAVLILESAKKLISDESAWSKEYLDFPTEYGHSYCVIGAIMKVVGFKHYPCRTENIMRKFLPQKKGFRSVFEFNDDPKTTHKQIMNLFDRAIKHYKEKAKLENV